MRLTINGDLDQGHHFVWYSFFLDICVDSNIMNMCDLEPDLWPN